jgi:hypothetical protein
MGLTAGKYRIAKRMDLLVRALKPSQDRRSEVLMLSQLVRLQRGRGGALLCFGKRLG